LDRRALGGRLRRCSRVDETNEPATRPAVARWRSTAWDGYTRCG